MRPVSALAILFGMVALAAAGAPSGRAQPGGRFPEWARSAIVLRSTTPRVAPDEEADPRGVIQRDTRLALGGRVERSEGDCRFFLEIDFETWVCGRDLDPSRDEPGGEMQPRMRHPEQLVPYLYARVNRGGAPLWSNAENVGRGNPVENHRGGFMLATTGGRRNAVLQTRDNLYVRQEDVSLYWPSRYEGVHLDGSLSITEIGWVRVLRASLYPAPGAPRSDRLRIQTPVVITDATSHPGFYRIESGGWVAAADIARPTLADLPEGVTPGEKWVDVDLDNQVLVAYEGERPVFATMISSGRQRADYITPIGTFRIWVKYAMADMDDIGNEDETRDYSAQGVPWVQYFDGSIGFHAAFWHNSFGQRMSHGCVNLSPRDSRFLYEWTEPHVSPGWTSVRPSPGAPGTAVRIREVGERPAPLSSSR